MYSIEVREMIKWISTSFSYSVAVSAVDYVFFGSHTEIARKEEA